MNLLLSSILLLCSISEEVKQFSFQAETKVDLEALEFLKDLQKDSVAINQGPCKKCRHSEVATPEKQNLLVFMSFSVPIESWKQWSHSMEKEGGVFVIRGLPQNSFKLFSQKVIELKMAGVKAPIFIDPEAFEKYRVQEVPTTVLRNGEKYDRISGNIRLDIKLNNFMNTSIKDL